MTHNMQLNLDIVRLEERLRAEEARRIVDQEPSRLMGIGAFLRRLRARDQTQKPDGIARLDQQIVSR